MSGGMVHAAAAGFGVWALPTFTIRVAGCDSAVQVQLHCTALVTVWSFRAFVACTTKMISLVGAVVVMQSESVGLLCGLSGQVVHRETTWDLTCRYYCSIQHTFFRVRFIARCLVVCSRRCWCCGLSLYMTTLLCVGRSWWLVVECRSNPAGYRCLNGTGLPHACFGVYGMLTWIFIH